MAALIALPFIGMEDQRLGPIFADPLPQAGPTNEISVNLGLFPLGNIPGHHFAAPDVDHQIEVEPDTTDAGGQVGDVPTPHLIGPLAFSRGTGRSCCVPRQLSKFVFLLQTDIQFIYHHIAGIFLVILVYSSGCAKRR